MLARFSPDFVMEISPLDLEPAGLTSRDLIARAERWATRSTSLTTLVSANV